MTIRRLLIEDTVDSEVVNFSLELLEKYKKQNIKTNQSTFTENGFQTPNVLKEYSPEMKIKLLKDHFHPGDLFHLHLIEYFEGGFQRLHDHWKTEYNSFILHLNDADGNTSFVFTDYGDRQDKDLECKPREGKIYYFHAHTLHQGKASFTGKKVLVGALQKKGQ